MDKNASLKRNALLVSVLSSFLSPFTASSITVALTNIGHDLSLDAVTLGWVPTAFLIAAAAFLVPFGRASDLYGRKKIFLWGMILSNISAIFAGFATSGATLIVWRAVQGLGSSMIFGTGITIVASVYPARQRGRALGIVLTSVYVGLSAGPFIGGVLTNHLGWRSLFFTNFIIGTIVILVTLWKIKEEWAEARGEKLDLAGSLVYVVSFSATMYGLTILPSREGILFLSGGILGLFIFGIWETRIEHPIFEVRLFLQNRAFLFSNLAVIVNYSATFAVTFLISLYLQYVQKLSPQAAGLVLISQPSMQAILTPFTGRLSDRIEPRIVSAFGMAILMLGLVFFAFIGPATPLAFIVLNLLFLGFGYALFVSPNTNAVMSSVERKFLGVASGTLATMRVIGQTLSMAIVMFIFALWIGRVQITGAYSGQFLHSIRIIFLIFTCLTFFGIFTCLASGKIHKSRKS
ncbi:MAG: MFS transporter [Syntrophorhabdus sp.]